MELFFPKGSVLRRVHRERVVGHLYGQRALLIQASHPLAFQGLIQSSRHLDKPYKRLVHTASWMEQIYFGSQEEAERVGKAVRKMHARVKGQLEQPAGFYPKGTPYRADDPELLMWVLAPLASSALYFYEHYVKPLSLADKERFWQDYRKVGRLFGLKDPEMPADYQAFNEYLKNMESQMYLTEEARELTPRICFKIPVRFPLKISLQLANQMIIASLPPRLRSEYGFSWTPAHSLAFLTQAGISRRLLSPLTPSFVRQAASSKDFPYLLKLR